MQNTSVKEYTFLIYYRQIEIHSVSSPEQALQKRAFNGIPAVKILNLIVILLLFPGLHVDL